MNWKKTASLKNHADDFQLSVLISAYNLKPKLELKYFKNIFSYNFEHSDPRERTKLNKNQKSFKHIICTHSMIS